MLRLWNKLPSCRVFFELWHGVFCKASKLDFKGWQRIGNSTDVANVHRRRWPPPINRLGCCLLHFLKKKIYIYIDCMSCTLYVVWELASSAPKRYYVYYVGGGAWLSTEGSLKWNHTQLLRTIIFSFCYFIQECRSRIFHWLFSLLSLFAYEYRLLYLQSVTNVK